MSYIPFSLRYRPQTFEEIVGQEHVSRTLQNAVAVGRVVHAYLFAGPRGTGKTSTARVLAKALLCEKGPTPHPCGECEICRAIAEGRCLDVVEIDAASNRGIEQIRELREKVRYSPAQARYKVYILDEVHMLTPEAFNALLKTLEEPPEHTFFVLATTELHRVPPTIVSRCQLFEFHLIPEARIAEALKTIADSEGVEVEDDALEEVARAAHGALRDAESIFDQVVAYADGPITADVVRDVLGVTPREAVAALVNAMATGDVARMLGELDELVAGGKDLAQLLYDVTLAARDMLRMALGAKASGEWTELEEAARALGPDKIAEGLRLLGEAEKRLREAVQQQITLELALVEVTETWARESAREFARAAAETARKRKSEQKPAPAQGQRKRESSSPIPSREGSQEEDGGEAGRSARARPSVVQEDAGNEVDTTSAGKPSRKTVEETTGEEEEEAGRDARADGLPIDASAEELAARWEELHHQLKRMRRVAVWAMLRNGRPVAVEEDVVVIGFDPQWKMHCDMVSGQYREDVERALAAVLRRQVRVRFVVAGVEASPQADDRTGGKAIGDRSPAKARPLIVESNANSADTDATEQTELAGRGEESEGQQATSAEETKQQDRREKQGEAREINSARLDGEEKKDAVDRAVELTLDIFPDSEEIEPE